MSLRGQVPDAEATFEDPILGVNLQSSVEDLQRGEAEKMQNLVMWGGLTTRKGSTAVNTVVLEAGKKTLGGHRYYFGVPFVSAERLIAYDKVIALLADNGTQTLLYELMSASASYVMFFTWSITDSVYITNGIDPIMTYDGVSVKAPGATRLNGPSYAWTLSGSGTNEYYVTSGGLDPGLADPTSTGGVFINNFSGPIATAKGTLGSLAAGQWGYGNNDTLGFNTVYVRLADGSDPDVKPNGYVQHSSTAWLPGSGINPAAVAIIGVGDRLFAITANGIERCDPRDPTRWSRDSSWATFRPSQPGYFRAQIPHTVATLEGAPVNGALAFTDSSYYFYTGTDFGDDVTADTPSTGEDGAISWVGNVGCGYPRAVESVPGLGTFWITHRQNVYFVPAGRVHGFHVGHRIHNSGGSSTTGINSAIQYSGGVLRDSWVVYWEPYLMVGFTVVGGTYPTIQYWLDLDKFRINPQVPVWYGPMVGQTVGCVWKENQQTDNSLKGGEGNASTGVFIYNLAVDGTYTDKIGTSTNNIVQEYITYAKSGGAPSREKYLEQIEIEMNTITGTATCDVEDLSGPILTGLPIEKTFVE